VAAIALRHATELVAELGEEAGARAFRKHARWYAQGFAGGDAVLPALGAARTLADYARAFAGGDAQEHFDVARIRSGRGKPAAPDARVALPADFARLRDDATKPRDPRAGIAVSGG
jgi:hypothetical protein